MLLYQMSTRDTKSGKSPALREKSVATEEKENPKSLKSGMSCGFFQMLVRKVLIVA
jgi:hypothetical protein